MSLAASLSASSSFAHTDLVITSLPSLLTFLLALLPLHLFPLPSSSISLLLASFVSCSRRRCLSLALALVGVICPLPLPVSFCPHSCQNCLPPALTGVIPLPTSSDPSTSPPHTLSHPLLIPLQTPLALPRALAALALVGIVIFPPPTSHQCLPLPSLSLSHLLLTLASVLFPLPLLFAPADLE
ncbi:hypothetical protein BJ508DRAFT_75481 [Ascobolus immersus RN42]|uniref:Uncharacterized protein n=1 Tax=Ascobolus immersus RN42 TaxID=1160509 RepID=A0A3N4HKE6_ASCIM|nr:hypothetical protein BJ508DRAFT_75481 [Ascobolus immersus RN42]